MQFILNENINTKARYNILRENECSAISILNPSCLSNRCRCIDPLKRVLLLRTRYLLALVFLLDRQNQSNYNVDVVRKSEQHDGSLF
jgi:hypothetical protein